MTAWKDHSGRPRHESGGLDPALPGALLVSALFIVAPASPTLAPSETSSFGRFGGGSCDSNPPADRSTTAGWWACGGGSGSGKGDCEGSDEASYWPDICVRSIRPGPPLSARIGWPHGWPPAEEWGIILGSFWVDVWSEGCDLNHPSGAHEGIYTGEMYGVEMQMRNG